MEAVGSGQTMPPGTVGPAEEFVFILQLVGNVSLKVGRSSRR